MQLLKSVPKIPKKKILAASAVSTDEEVEKFMEKVGAAKELWKPKEIVLT